MPQRHSRRGLYYTQRIVPEPMDEVAERPEGMDGEGAGSNPIAPDPPPVSTARSSNSSQRSSICGSGWSDTKGCIPQSHCNDMQILLRALAAKTVTMNFHATDTCGYMRGEQDGDEQANDDHASGG